MFIELLAIGAALAQPPAPPPLVLPQPWAVDARRDDPFVWVTPAPTRMDWTETRVSTDYRAHPQTAAEQKVWDDLSYDREPHGRSESLVDLAILEDGRRWDLSSLVIALRLGERERDDMRGAGASSVGWSLDDAGDVRIDGSTLSGRHNPWSLWQVIEEPFAHGFLVSPAGPVVPGDTWKESTHADVIEMLSAERQLIRMRLSASGRFEGWVKHDRAWLALVSFELHLWFDTPLNAELRSTSHLLVDPASGLPVWAACLDEWTNDGREPWSDLILRERDPQP